ncbi:MAG: protein kinase [Myxococcota bacterium]|jgi:serine/threonine protein kinase|nr:protein kinase [Myxococcota bacterium]
MSLLLPLSEAQKFGPYELTHRFRRVGKLGPAYRATHRGVEGFEKALFIKKFESRFTQYPDFVTALVDKSTVAVRLHHANIVQVLELGHSDGHYFMAMEYVGGCDLATLFDASLALSQRIPEEIGLLLAIELLQALDYAHRVRDPVTRGHVVHGDLSPSDVLVTWEGEVKVTDFGLNAALESLPPECLPSSLERSRYLAPEQGYGEAASVQSDIYAVGVLLFELFAGCHPYPQVDVRQTPQLAQAPLLAESGIIDPELAHLVDCMLRPEPEARCTHASDFQEPLLRFKAKRHPSANARQLALWLSHTYEAYEEWQKQNPSGALELSPDELDAELMVEEASSSDTAPTLPCPAGLERVADNLRQAMRDADDGRGHAFVLAGASGTGKSHALRFAINSYGSDSARPLLAYLWSDCAALPLAVPAAWARAAVGYVDGESGAALDGRVARFAKEHHIDTLQTEALRQLCGLERKQFLSPGTLIDASLHIVLATLRRAEGSTVLAVDHCEHADRASLDFLDRLVDTIPQERALLLVATADPSYEDELQNEAWKTLHQGEADLPTRLRILFGTTQGRKLNENSRMALASMPESCGSMLLCLNLASVISRSGYPLEQGVNLLIGLDPPRRLATAIQTMTPPEIQVLQWLAASQEALSVNKLRQLVALPPAVLHGVLQQLLNWGLIVYTFPGHLGFALRELGSTLLSLYDRSLVAMLHEHLAHVFAAQLLGGDLDIALLRLRNHEAAAGQASSALSRTVAIDRALDRAGFADAAFEHAHCALRDVSFADPFDAAFVKAKMALVEALRAVELLQWNNAREKLDAVYRSPLTATRAELFLDAVAIDARLLSAEGKFSLAAERIEEAQERAHGQAIAAGESVLRLQSSRAEWCLAYGELFAAEDACTRALTASSNVDAEQAACVHGLRAVVLSLRGLPRGAENELLLARQFESSYPSQRSRLAIARAEAHLALALGELDAACDALELCFDLANESGLLLDMLGVGVSLIDNLIRDGRGPRARKLISKCERMAKSHGAHHFARQIQLAQQYLAAAYRGDESAMTALQHALDSAIEEGVPAMILRAASFLAEALERQGKRDEAERVMQHVRDVRQSRGYDGV